MPHPVAIDPPGCGCTECLVGEYVPLNLATDNDIRALLAGRIRDNTDSVWTVAYEAGPAGRRTVVTTSGCNRWEFKGWIPAVVDAGGTVIVEHS